MIRKIDRKIILEDGQEYYGYGFGADKETICEIVFNTSMAGYQEILSDPSYTYQAVVMTYPLIGNYGMADDDYETEHPSVGAMIVREYNDHPSNFRSTATLGEVMKRWDIPGVWGVDTRKLTRSIRDLGSRKVMITGVETETREALKRLREYEIPADAVSKVSCPQVRVFPAEHEKFRVAAIDCGMKKSMIDSMNRRGLTVTVVPWNTTAEAIEDMRPDGIFVSNGPGDPADVPQTIETVRRLIGEYPMFGVCLGHQIISLACGAKTYKLKFGHRGGNHPVKNLLTGKVEITSQNHSYAVSTDGIEKTRVEITHINLLDQTVEGLRIDEDRIFSTQYHPESASGPEDSKYLFGLFIHNMEAMKEGR